MKKRLLTLLFISMLLSTTNVLTANAQVQTQGAYIRECVGYNPKYVTKNYPYKKLDSIIGDNRKGDGPMKLSYTYKKSGSVTSTINGYVNASAEASTVFAKVKAETGIAVSKSRSWKQGTSAGVTYSVPKGKYQEIGVYIPATKTEGKLKYKVYMDGYPDKTFYEYKTLTTSYAIQKNGILFKIL